MTVSPDTPKDPFDDLFESEHETGELEYNEDEPLYDSFDDPYEDF